MPSGKPIAGDVLYFIHFFFHCVLYPIGEEEAQMACSALRDYPVEFGTQPRTDSGSTILQTGYTKLY